MSGLAFNGIFPKAAQTPTTAIKDVDAWLTGSTPHQKLRCKLNVQLEKLKQGFRFPGALIKTLLASS
jgi:hypothetical protein